MSALCRVTSATRRDWGYGTEVLQSDILVGYRSKPRYLLSLIIREMTMEDAEGRVVYVSPPSPITILE
ncbi:hypothetical protein BJX63DRAFT_411983 [Aspergillus granulosus]|uniref:Uncharacterized protein n=1 Tax=Aspergillus granulosus TaxID=176169 RepID=A0ABR4GWI5_9EURO